MSTFASLFHSSVSYDAFVSQGTDDEQNALRAVQAVTDAPDFFSAAMKTTLASLTGQCYLLVAAEMWCPDCHRNLPPIHALSQALPAAPLGIISRAQAETLFISAFRLEKVKVPFAVVLDDRFQPLGCFIERPATAASRPDAYKQLALLGDTVAELVAVMQARS